MTNRVCIIGSGPTGIYTLKNLAKSDVPLRITIYEAEKEVGKGTPYLPCLNDPVMLSNIPSIEIPELTVTLLEWLRTQPEDYLQRFGIERHRINGRQFYPRLVLGDYFHDQLSALIAQAEAWGHEVIVKPDHQVSDIALHDDGISVTVDCRKGFTATFDHAVMATGHDWPDRIEPSPGYFTSPWPASALDSIGDGHIGILGTSLSAIDAVMTIATSNGIFLYDPDGNVTFEPAGDRTGFAVTMMSRKGLLPEADFYCPLPYLEPRYCTIKAVENAIAKGPPGLLDRVFELFRRELAAADPDYAAEIGLATLTVDTFADAYYARRADVDPFLWAAANLAEAEKNLAEKHTVPWRYAILITHEVIARAIPHLDRQDFSRFNRSFKSIFADEYATVPHLSIKRLLALRNAGVLDILKLGDDYQLETETVARGARVRIADRQITFDGFIEAMGQKALSADDLPFPSLVNDPRIKKAPTPDVADAFQGDGAHHRNRSGGIDIDEHYRIKADGTGTKLFCAAIPFLLHKDPFVQGITSAAHIGETVAKTIIEDVSRAGIQELLLVTQG